MYVRPSVRPSFDGYVYYTLSNSISNNQVISVNIASQSVQLSTERNSYECLALNSICNFLFRKSQKQNVACTISGDTAPGSIVAAELNTVRSIGCAIPEIVLDRNFSVFHV